MFTIRPRNFRDTEEALAKAELFLQKAQAAFRQGDQDLAGLAFLEAGLIYSQCGVPSKRNECFDLAVKHYPETSFLLSGFLEVVSPNSPLHKKVLLKAFSLDSGKHEDGSMESAIPYFRNIVSKSNFIYSGPAKRIAAVLLNDLKMTEGKIVDVGTGTAPFAIALKRQLPATIKMVGYDVSKQMLEVARGIILGLRTDIDLVLGPVIHPGDERKSVLPFQTTSIDVIISHGSMHHWGGGKENVQYVEAMFEELIRILKPMGRMFICDINPSSAATKLIMKSKILIGLGRRYHHEAFFHSAEHCLGQAEIAQIIRRFGHEGSWRVRPVKPLFPAGLIFHMLEFTKN